MKKIVWISVCIALAVLVTIAITELLNPEKEEPPTLVESTSSAYEKPEVIVPDFSMPEKSSEAAEKATPAPMPEIVLEDSADTKVDREAVILPRQEEPTDEGK